MNEFTVQHRGGKGIKGMQTIEEDYIEDLLMTTNHHYMMFFTNTGRVYRLKAYEIPGGRTYSQGNGYYKPSPADAGGEDYGHYPHAWI